MLLRDKGLTKQGDENLRFRRPRYGMRRTVRLLLDICLAVGIALGPISDNDAQYPDVDAKEEQRSEEQPRYKGGEAKELEVVSLAQPESLKRCQNRIASREKRDRT